MNNGWWTIPSEKAKNNLSHRVPLSSLALQLLDQVKLHSGNSRWLFPSRQGDKPVLDTSIDHALHKNEAKFAIPPCHKEVNPQYVTYFQVITPHEIFLF